PDKIILLKSEKDALMRIKEDLLLLEHKDELLEKRNRMLSDLNIVKQNDKKQQLDALRDMDVTHVDRSGWQEFILHAVNFIESYEYPQENDRCIFCNQSLHQNARELIEKYKNLFKGANNKLGLLQNEISEVDKKLYELQFVESKLSRELQRIEDQKDISNNQESAPAIETITKSREQIQAYIQVINGKLHDKQIEIDQHSLT
ncbi:hypothetical protein AB4Z22_41375, partial [Paenibacillus sp. TAF58]